MAAQAQPIVINGGGNTHVGWYVAGAALAAGVYWVYGKPYFDKLKADAELKKQQQSTIESKKGKPVYDLNGKPVKSANLATIAADIYQALNPGWYKPNDNKRAVRAFKNTPFGYVGQLEKFYLEKYQQNLRDEMAKMPDEDWIQVKFWFK